MSIFKNFSPKYFGNNKLKPVSNYGPIPSWPFTGLAPGSAPAVNLQSTHAPFGDPKLMLNNYPGVFKLTE